MLNYFYCSLTQFSLHSLDTNIIVSSFITKNPSSSTRRVINSMLSGKIKPLYNEEILDEYFDVYITITASPLFYK
ncbi:MAG: PIN domain-containing protein [Segatella copri]